MKFTKCFIVLGLCMLIGSCDIEPRIDIGDYDGALTAWNSQNMLDYQLSVWYFSEKNIIITVRNGTAVSSDPSEWLASGKESTIPDFFSLIKKKQKEIKNGGYLHAYYDTKYHYPRYISGNDGGGIGLPVPVDYPSFAWDIKLTPLKK
jgi:hypothetical protein